MKPEKKGLLLDYVLFGSLYTTASQVYRNRTGETFFQITRKPLNKLNKQSRMDMYG
jgi:hypothetical protein